MLYGIPLKFYTSILNQTNSKPVNIVGLLGSV